MVFVVGNDTFPGGLFLRGRVDICSLSCSVSVVQLEIVKTCYHQMPLIVSDNNG